MKKFLISALGFSVLVASINVISIYYLGRESELMDELFPIVFQVLWVSLPFIIIPIIGYRSSAALIYSVLITFVLIIFFVVSVMFSKENDANIGLGMLMFLSPFFVTLFSILLTKYRRVFVEKSVPEMGLK